MANKRILTVVPATSQDLKTPAPMYSLQWKFPKQGTIRWKSDIEIQELQTVLIIVNDMAIEKLLQLPVQADKTAWQTAETEISLQNGINYIIIQNSTSKGGCFELDYIKIRKKS